MNTIDQNGAPGSTVPIDDVVEHHQDRKLEHGCTQKVRHIEPECEDSDDSAALMTDVVENSWIDEPEEHDLLDVMMRNERGANRRSWE